MSDLFHEGIPLDYIERVFEVMNRANWHRFQVLTKRADRLAEIAGHLNWTKNIWMGVSVENDRHIRRIDFLREVPSAVRFLSLEPLLGSLPGLNLKAIDWVIVGGESGPGSRKMEEGWVVEILDLCRQDRVPFFFKQWGGTNKKKAGRLLNGRTFDEMPNPDRRSRTSVAAA